MKNFQSEVKDIEEIQEALEPLRPDLIELLLEHQKDFKNFLKRQISNPTVVEDLLQQTFVKALEQSEKLHQDEKLLPWFYRILKNWTAPQKLEGIS